MFPILNINSYTKVLSHHYVVLVQRKLFTKVIFYDLRQSLKDQIFWEIYINSKDYEIEFKRICLYIKCLYDNLYIYRGYIIDGFVFDFYPWVRMWTHSLYLKIAKFNKQYDCHVYFLLSFTVPTILNFIIFMTYENLHN